MSIVNSIATWYFRKRIRQIEIFRDHPHDVQRGIFQKLIAAGENTEWGKNHNYKNIRTVEDFQKNVPLQDYDSLLPYIERMLKGEQKVLWPEEINWFAKSSGTTATRSKFIPVSPDSLEGCHYKGFKDMLSIHCTNFPDCEIFSGKTLMLGGSHQVSELNGSSFCGDLSAVLLQNMPLWSQMFRAPDLSIALMHDWEKKIVQMAETTIKENITSIAGVPSWTLVLANHILDITGKNNLTEVWPELELYMHGGVSFTPYREQFRKLIPSTQMRYVETYNASEGFFGLEDEYGTGNLLLMLDYGIFYEFVPMSEWGSENPSAVTLEGVEEGVNYALVISTNSGLWRYIPGDTVKFTSTKPYRIRITGRTRHFLNAFGEEVIVENSDQAIAEACKATSALFNDYTAAPVFMDGQKNGGHEWLIEFEKEPENKEHFIAILDSTLRSINSDYDAKRAHNYIMKEPVVHFLPKGSFYDWMKSRGKLGGQNKVPRLSNDRSYLEDILALRKVSQEQ